MVTTTRFLFPLVGFVALVVSLAAAGCGTKTIVQQQGPGGGASSSGEVGGRRDSVPCTPGDKTLPIDVFDTNTDPASTVCDPVNVLDDDGAPAVLSWSGTTPQKVIGHDESGCVAVEFSDGVTIKSFGMKMRPVGAGCGGVACTQGGSDGCGTGWKVSILAGPSLDKMQYLQELSLSQADFFDYRVVVYPTFKAKFAVVCRDPTAATGDSIAIDSVYGFCN